MPPEHTAKDLIGVMICVGLNCSYLGGGVHSEEYVAQVKTLRIPTPPGAASTQTAALEIIDKSNIRPTEYVTELLELFQRPSRNITKLEKGATFLGEVYKEHEAETNIRIASVLARCEKETCAHILKRALDPEKDLKLVHPGEAYFFLKKSGHAVPIGG